jgi:hypothetical protein
MNLPDFSLSRLVSFCVFASGAEDFRRVLRFTARFGRPYKASASIRRNFSHSFAENLLMRLQQKRKSLECCLFFG